MGAARDRLEEYRRRRDFRKSPEPGGASGKKRSGKPVFVVQKHDATRLHYDFRLEWDGVLLSWAVTRGPSLDPAEKRLAVRTEDHPLGYADFEGVIPKDEYGGGAVMIWDQGVWDPLSDPAEGLAGGHLKFTLHGNRMKGNWVLVRMKPKTGESRENWLLIKEKDDFASRGDSLTEAHETSVVSDRTLSDIASGKRGKPVTPGRRGKRKGRLANPAFVEPQLATLVDEVPEGDDWLFEVKFDGYRTLASIGSGGVILYTRSGQDWTDRYAGLPETLGALDCRSALIDGEVITGRDSGSGSGFSRLQDDLKQGRPVRLMAFDLLELDGRDLTGDPIESRKAKLEDLLSPVRGKAVRYSEHVTGHGAHVFRRIADAGGEGVIAKRAGSTYDSTRSRAWLKVKATRRQEFVIGGYSPSSARGRPFASLLLGTMEGEDLVYRGRVGTGFDGETLATLEARLGRRGRKTSPFSRQTEELPSAARWVRPDLVAEIEFSEFTGQGILRHAVFQGLRDDKEASEVTREDKPDRQDDAETAFRGITISHADRVIFSEAGITKGDLAAYCDAAGERLFELAGHRPVSLLRCPSGAGTGCFFQKHAGKGFPREIDAIAIEEAGGGGEDYMVIRQQAGFVAAVQMGTIEFHVWGAKEDRLEQPDRLVFDLDPDEGLGFSAVTDAAIGLRDLLGQLDLPAIPMVTGGKGVHVIAPLRRGADWETVRIFAKTIASHCADRYPDRFTASMSKQKRKGRIFIDWLRNERGATAVAPYSVRNRAGAPVAMPLTWDELGGQTAADGFSIADALKRLSGPCPLIETRASHSISKSVVARLDEMIERGSD
ncbi:DNA ligase D [Zhengella mangrovi]|uniref:DNA ligase (ATP) n=1 Tax=Zhengella mangrovi TaxID=1982044 RepID=A0A2G1QP00_9HYPH|nr:DNA ligase D [Zhengella mangrovi]PHP67201.1 DNA ligase D [Zhengella mangrovi]